MSIPLVRFLYAFTVLLTAYGAAQQVRRPLITRPIDDNTVVTLPGNTHPMALPAFEVGTAPPDLPMRRMLLTGQTPATRRFQPRSRRRWPELSL